MPDMFAYARIEPFVGAFADNGVLIAVKVTLVLGLSALLLRFNRRGPSTLRSAIASLALLSGIVIPLLMLTCPGWKVPLHEIPGFDSSIVSNAPVSGQADEPTVGLIGATTRVANEPPDSGATSSTAGRRDTAMLLLALEGIWAIGLLLGILWLVRAGLRIRSLVNASDPIDAEWQSLLDEGRSQLALRRRVSLRFGPDGLIPTTTGILRPVILLPRDAREWPEPRRRAVLLHELAHVARRDVMMQLAERVSCLVHWFNPWIWKLARVADLERERACDDRVLASGIPAGDYAEDLLLVASGRRRLPFALGMASPTDLGTRVEAILSSRRGASRLPHSAGFAGIALAIASLPLIALATIAPDDAVHGPLAPFSRVTSELPITVVLEPGETPHISMDGDPEEIARIRPEVIDGELVLRHDARDARAFSWRDDAQRHGRQKQLFDVVVHVRSPEFEAITNRAGRGRIETAAPLSGRSVEINTNAGFLDLNLACSEVRIRTRGSGVITLRGTGETGLLDLRGGIVDARNLSLGRVGVRASGGICTLGRSEKLDVFARGSAHVSYRGDPKLTEDIGRDAELEREP